MTKANRNPLIYARICIRLVLRRNRSPLESLGLPGVQSRERIEGVAHGRSGRFDAPGFPALYAAEALKTCQLEVAHHLKTRYLDHKPDLGPSEFHYHVMNVPLAGRFDDLRSRGDAMKWLRAPTPRAYPACRQYAAAVRGEGFDGLIYASSRHRGGTCIARFISPGQRIPMEQVGTWVLTWTGKRLVVGN